MNPDDAVRKVPIEFDTSMAAQGVLIECAIYGNSLLVTLSRVIDAEKKKGHAPEETMKLMIQSWQDLVDARPHLKFYWGAEKFFGEGNWKTKAGWPWKDGLRFEPGVRRIQPESVNDEVSDMSFARWGIDSDVYVYAADEGYHCWTKDKIGDALLSTPKEMAMHLIGLRATGQKVPQYAIDDLVVEADATLTEKEI